MGASGEVRNS